MTHDATTVDGTQSAQPRRHEAEVTHPALVLVWSRAEPERVGEVLLVEKRRRADPVVVGRGEGAAAWCRQRPGQTIATGPLTDPKLSRRQLEITPGSGGGLTVNNVGRGQLLGTEDDVSIVYPGQTVGIAGRALWLVTERPTHLPGITAFPEELWPVFGAPDAFGIVGESPACWRLREALGLAAAAPGHVLILGPSGAGKELAAKAIHGLSDRRRGPYVTRNAAAIPEGLVAAELFGNLAGYPNPGTPARDGLVGAAHGGFLLLDEIGELSPPAQAALLRVLDTEGEYQRLGESKARRSDLRVLGATNRPVPELRPDFAARFSTTVTVPTLGQRLEDVPLLALHLLEDRDPSSPPEQTLVQALLAYDFPLQVRELRAILLRPEPDAPLLSPDAAQTGPAPERQGIAAPLSPESLRAALAANYGDREATARSLGLSSRFALYRLMKKLGVGT